MDFLMEAFRTRLSQYRYDFSLTRNNDHSYTLILKNLPDELDFKLITLKGDNNQNIFTPIRNLKMNMIRADFYENDYAMKINKIDACIRYFTEKNFLN